MGHITVDRERLLQACERDDILFIGVFGSSARGDIREGSDIDLLVQFSRRKSLLDLVRLERELSEILGRKVDLLTEASISPYMIDGIKADLGVIYERTGRQDILEAHPGLDVED